MKEINELQIASDNNRIVAYNNLNKILIPIAISYLDQIKPLIKDKRLLNILDVAKKYCNNEAIIEELDDVTDIGVKYLNSIGMVREYCVCRAVLAATARYYIKHYNEYVYRFEEVKDWIWKVKNCYN